MRKREVELHIDMDFEHEMDEVAYALDRFDDSSGEIPSDVGLRPACHVDVQTDDIDNGGVPRSPCAHSTIMAIAARDSSALGTESEPSQLLDLQEDGRSPDGNFPEAVGRPRSPADIAPKTG